MAVDLRSGRSRQRGQRRQRMLLARAVATLCFALAAVSASWSAARAGDAPRSITVEIIDNAFAPSVISVPPGGTIVFRNSGLSVHEVVAGDSTFDSGPLQPGESWTLAVGMEEVRITIRCAIHSEMTGEIDVSRQPFQPGAGAAATPTSAITTAATGPGASGARTTALGSSGRSTPGRLAMTGDESTRLAILAVAFLLLGAAVLAVARPKPVPLLASIPRNGDDLLPARDRARRSV